MSRTLDGIMSEIGKHIEFPPNDEWGERYEDVLTQAVGIYKDAAYKHKKKLPIEMFGHLYDKLGSDDRDFIMYDYAYFYDMKLVIKAAAKVEWLRHMFVGYAFMGKEALDKLFFDTGIDGLTEGWGQASYDLPSLSDKYVHGKVSRQFAATVDRMKPDKLTWEALETFYKTLRKGT